MSKKKGKTKIKLGKFYNVRDGSPKGHPGYIFNINRQIGEYDAIITETTYKKGLIPIRATDNNVSKSYIKPHPFRGTRNDYGEKVYEDMHFDADAYTKAESVKKKQYIFGSHYKKKHKLNKKMGN